MLRDRQIVLPGIAGATSVILGSPCATGPRPVRVVGFNTSEGWSRDVSDDVAQKLRYRCDRFGLALPANLEAFIEQHNHLDRAQPRLV
jgi:hypothetical protein